MNHGKVRMMRAGLLAVSAPVFFGACVAMLPMGSTALAQASAGTSGGNGVGSAFELTFWQSVSTSDDAAQLEAYLAQYPQGTFSALARAKIAAIARANPSAHPVAAAPALPIAVATPVAVAAPVAVAVPAPVAPAAVATPPVPIPAVAPVTAPAAIPAPAPVNAAAPIPGSSAPTGAAASAIASVPVAAPVPVPAAPPSDPFAKLRAINAARAAAAAGIAPPPEAATARPARPVLAAVPVVSLPPRFCTAEERNSFHEMVYKSAVAVADHNNQAAIAYLDALQAEHDARIKGGQIEPANAIAKEAADYKSVAQQAYEDRSSFTGLFDRMMAVPIGCS